MLNWGSIYQKRFEKKKEKEIEKEIKEEKEKQKENIKDKKIIFNNQNKIILNKFDNNNDESQFKYYENNN